MRLHLIATMLALVVTVAYAAAQVERVLPSKGESTLEGTSFIVGFMQNEITEFPEDRVLKIFISSQYDAHVQVEQSTGRVDDVFLRANDVAVVDLPQIYMMNESELLRRQAAFITSDVPVVVYVLNSIALSTDTYTAIPITALGKEYYTVNRPNDQYQPTNDPYGDVFNLTVRQSEFMVMAVEDQTTVEITPTYATERGLASGRSRSITMRRGECYLVKSRTSPIGMGDLTGSHVTADKPVAVLSGAVRSGIPVAQTSSKDHVVEMLPPLESWGSTYAAVPFAVVTRTAANKVRIVAAQDDTKVLIQTASGTRSKQLAAAGDWTEIDLREPTLYSSDKPFLAVQFMPSRQYSPFAPKSDNGDPAMVVLPAVDQYLSSTMFRFPELLPQTQLPAQDFLYYVTIVAEESAVPSLAVNGLLVVNLDPMFVSQTIPGTNLHWSNLQLPLGTYSVSANTGLFGGIMYGLSQADSYANLFGANYTKGKRTPPTPPEYSFKLDCGQVSGFVKDVPLDSGNLTEVSVQTSRCINYEWELNGPIDSTGTMEVTARIKDLWKDARFVIHAYDSLGSGREWLYDYHAPSMSIPSNVEIDGSNPAVPCTRVPIVNTGDYPLHIREVRLAGDARITITPRPITDTTIAPGDTLWLQACFFPNKGTGTNKTTLYVELDCGLKKTTLIQGVSSAQYVTVDVDLGAVRIADTACGRAAIVNVGPTPITITSLDAFKIAKPFEVDTASIGLPVSLPPGDTLWIPVCFIPTAETVYTRIDTVTSIEAGATPVTYRGKGVRPRVPSIVIDWGKRRVGVVSDTSFLIGNTGAAACRVDTQTTSTLSAEFSLSGVSFPVDLAAQSAQLVHAGFAPSVVGMVRDTIFLNVDWRLHEPAYIVLVGEGILPTVQTNDVNMGQVIVNTSKDSVVFVLESGGSDALTIFTKALSGADTASFVIGAGLEGPALLQPGSRVSIPIRFSPQRLGLHEMDITLTHDAAPSGEIATSTIHVVGVGISVPIKKLDVELVTPTRMTACTKDSGWVVLKNEGTVAMVINEIQVTVDGAPVDVYLDSTTVIVPQATLEIPFVLTVDRSSGADVSLNVRYDSVEFYYATSHVSVDISTPQAQLSMPATASAGQKIFSVLTIQESAVLEVPQPLSFNVTFSSDQWSVSREPITIDIADASGVWQETIAPFTISGGVQYVVAKPLLAPYTANATIAGTLLLNTFGGVLVHVTVAENACSETADCNGLTVIDVCGGPLRLVRVNGNPRVSMFVDANPVTSTLGVRFDVSESTTAEIELRGLDGGGLAYLQQLKLEKGDQHCNFSVTSLASGFYLLVLRDGSGEQVVPIVIVN